MPEVRGVVRAGPCGGAELRLEHLRLGARAAPARAAAALAALHDGSERAAGAACGCAQRFAR